MADARKIEYRAVIKFLTKEGNMPQEIKNRLDAVYRQASPSYSTVKEWSKRFRMGRETLKDDERAGRPESVITNESIAAIDALVLNDRRLNVKELSAMSGLSDTTVRRIIHDHLGMNKICARWVPKILSAVQKQRRVECARVHLNMCEADGNEFLQTIVTGDETMVLYHDPLSKRDLMEWHRPGEKRPVKAKVSPSAKKIMATVFWDTEGILLIDFKERNTTINGEYYASLLHKLRQSIVEKRRGKLTRGVNLPHDNTPVHTANVAQAAVRDCGFHQIDHPPYSPDMAPSDFFLFSNLKKELRGKRFSDDDELKAAVWQHFDNKLKEYFFKGIQLLIKRCVTNA